MASLISSKSFDREYVKVLFRTDKNTVSSIIDIITSLIKNFECGSGASIFSKIHAKKYNYEPH
jgi:hypothetical protein